MANIVFIVVCSAKSHYIGCCTINKKERQRENVGLRPTFYINNRSGVAGAVLQTPL